MKYKIEFEDENGKVGIETKHIDSARKFLDALEQARKSGESHGKPKVGPHPHDMQDLTA